MAAVVGVSPLYQFSDAQGRPLALGSVDVYLAGTTTRTDTWQDPQQLTKNQNPVPLNASGTATIYLDSALAYKWVVKSAAGVTQPHLGGDNIVGNAVDADIAQQGTTALAAMQTLFNLFYLAGE